ncbi:ADP-ribosylglycohydrolase family protein [Fusibacter sp. JL216-2]|uniref:ADP-ribosylglycohydrolase family protein n=1 Tax=Fusibacter sp. JL216-2 TaxID=3071453 RepID=UPI003D3446E9
MNDKLRGMLLGSFVADALALGPHWIYDMDKIEDKFGDIKGLTSPLEDSFHKNKTKGDFTHYGDQMMALLNHLVESDGFDVDEFKSAWLDFMKDYEGYKDHATKDSIQLYSSISDIGGSDSDELGGPARMAPLVYKLCKLDHGFEDAVVLQTKMTHTGGDVLDMARALAKILDKVLGGKKPSEAMEEVAQEMGGVIANYIEQGIEHNIVDPREMIPVFGQNCSGKSAFPSVMYFINRYEDDFEEALIENVAVGGDSAARGIVIGMILGAYHGEKTIPKEWLKDMKAYDEILAFMDR